ncbi:MAG: M42 family metallopeptidase [Aestuariivirga sp.]
MSLRQRLSSLTQELMLIPGLSGYETRVRKRLRAEMEAQGFTTTTDRLGNLIVTLKGSGPSVMLIAHMDQLGFVVRKIEANGLIRLERLGGVPERALAAQEVLICVAEGRDIPAVIANKSHHATAPEEKYRVVPYAELYVDAGFRSADEAKKAGVDVGSPVVYGPRAFEMANGHIAGTSIDDRAACAVMVEVARALKAAPVHPTVHFVFSVQEEFNLRGALPAAQALQPDICIQLDLILATDTPDMGARGNVALGHGPGMGMYSFHGRGTLNGCLPHPSLVKLFDVTASALNMNLQRSAHIGGLTETSYVQLVGNGVACIDMGFPCRYTHSALEVCDSADLEQLTRLLAAALGTITPAFSLDRDAFPQ